MHTTVIVGRLGSDPKPLGQVGCYFSVATDHYNAKTQARDTTWSRIKAFGQSSEFATKYLTKGRLVSIICHYENSEYDDPKTGTKRQDHYFVVDRIEPLPDGSNRQAQPQAGFGAAGPQATPGSPLWEEE